MKYLKLFDSVNNRDEMYKKVKDSVFKFFDFMDIGVEKNTDSEFVIKLPEEFEISIKIRFTDPTKFANGIRITLSTWRGLKYPLDEDISEICDILGDKFEDTKINTQYTTSSNNPIDFQIWFNIDDTEEFLKLLQEAKENELSVYLSSKKFGI